MQYLFSRFHLTQQIEQAQKNKYLKTGLLTKATVELRKFRYKFFDVTDALFRDENYLIGSLVKYDPDAVDETVDETGEKITKVQNANKAIAKVNFILHPTSSLLIFQDGGSLLSVNTFYEVFIKLFSQNHSGEDVISISPIQDEYSFIETVGNLTEIKKIVIELVPSNPHFGEHWEDIDKKLKERKITNYKEIQENKKEGEGIVPDTETKNKFYMSEDGYGVSTVIGKQNDKLRTITTKKKNKQVKKRVPNGLGDDKQSLLEQFFDITQQILKRSKD
eukprot:TRINITY_DN4801_c0_g2_i1.p1 TRINITY_DN4801_c0_g2~~TRINITY_DN4801_c0_g2_i1.p1  ORF type:complete len:277 (-),score=35.69 TRINITY_DN4801_c0_g2_i1:772-1602(-)